MSLRKIFTYAMLFSIQLLEAVPTQVILIRHGEKLDQKNPGPYLSRVGVLRSLMLPSYFAQNYPVPAALFAKKPHGSSSMRTVQTVAPTANYFASLYPKQANNFVIKTYRKWKSVVQQVLTEKAYEGHSVIICWIHDDLPEIACKLGVNNAPKWHGDNFNWVWIIDYNTDGTVKSFSIKEQPLFKI